MKRADQVIAVCGVLLFISLFLPFFHIGAAGFGVSASAKGHQSGFLAWGGLWIGFLAGGLGFFPALGAPWPNGLPVTKTIATLGVSALATLLLVLRFLFKPGGGGDDIAGIHIGVSRSFGLYFALVVVIVQVVFSVLAFRESGESLPSKADFQGLGGKGSAQGGYTPPPAQGYTPPPAPGYTPPAESSSPPPATGYAPPPPASWQNPQPPAEG